MKRQVRAKRMEWHIITRPTGSQLLFSFSRVIIFGIPSWCFLGGLKAELVTGTGICGYTRCLKAMCDENCMSSSFHMIRSSCRSWTRRKAPKTANDTNKTQAPVVLVIHSERFRAGNTAGRHWHTRISVSRGLSRISKGPVSQANKKEKRKRKKKKGGGGGVKKKNVLDVGCIIRSRPGLANILYIYMELRVLCFNDPRPKMCHPVTG